MDCCCDDVGDVKLKIVLLGDGGVGKTSLLHRICHERWARDVTATIQINFDQRTVKRDDQNIVLNVWDTAGQERFRSIAPIYYRDADAAIVVYDITHKNSVTSLSYWIRQLNAFIEDGLSITIVGNKTDCEHLRKVTTEEILEKVEFRNGDKDSICLVETSAKNPQNFDEILDQIVDRALVAHLSRRKKKQPAKKGHVLLGEKCPQKKNCCGI